jgi:DNA recombination protein RmuC
MQTTLLIILCLLAVIILVLQFMFRPQANQDLAAIFNRQTDSQNQLSRLETNMKEDFRINRDENSRISSENRSELNQTLTNFRSEQTETFKNLSENSQNLLKQINGTLDERLSSLTLKIEENNRTNREELTKSIADFSETNRLLLDKINNSLKEDSKSSREELTNSLKSFQVTFDQSVKSFNDLQREKFNDLGKKQAELIEKTDTNIKQNRDELSKSMTDFSTANIEQLDKINNQVKDDSRLIREGLSTAFKTFQESVEAKQTTLVLSTNEKLESIRSTVEEKLEKTLSERLGQSFETVGKQLIEVQKGLGEMQTLAQDVGGLKRVLSNVKMRGGIGEVQLEMLLEQILAPEQYQANVKTKVNSNDLVEFAVKLPGKDDNHDQVWLPIDAKFPKDVYEQLLNAYDTSDNVLIEAAQKALDNTIRKMAKDISEKYIDPPHTTDFGIMFLPFEGIYAEVVRKASLLEDLQRNYKIIVTGPTTLAAILNSLQMGFRTLAIQKRSSEVWQVLGAVKKEFENFGGLMQKAQRNIQTGLNQLDDVMGKRTKAIQRQLRGVEALNEIDASIILTEIADSALYEDEEVS